LDIYLNELKLLLSAHTTLFLLQTAIYQSYTSKALYPGRPDID